MGKQKYTLDDLIKLAKTFQYKSDFKKISGHGYKILRENNLLNEIFPENKNTNKWSIETIKKLACKYSSKTEFYKEHRYLQKLILQNNWTNIIFPNYTTLGSKYNRCIYAFEFSDNSVYIGLTYNTTKRIYQHLHDKTSQVFKHIQNNNVSYVFKQLTDYVNCFEASTLETKYLQQYKNENWQILNIAKTGGLGSLKMKQKQCCKNKKHTYETVKCDALKCITKKEFYNKYRKSYTYALRHNFLDDVCSHMQKYRHENWTKNTALLEIQKYNTLSEFRKENYNCYLFCFRNNIDIPLPKGHKHIYDEENVSKILGSYNSLSELRNSNDSFIKGCYWWLKRKKLLNTFKIYLKNEKL